MSKIATDLEQSKKLAEILPIESADMMWTYDFTVNDINGLNIISDKLKPEDNDVPAWSLSALLSILPLGIYDEFDSTDYELEINMIDKMPRYIRLGDIYHSQFPYDFEKDTLLDNIVESIIWLNDNNYFES